MCQDGYTAVEVSPLTKNPFICTDSPYMQQNAFNLPVDTNLIPNCAYYTLKNNLIDCYECKFGYLVLEKNQKKTCI